VIPLEEINIVLAGAKLEQVAIKRAGLAPE
jgi:hypothetical protein